jgi:CDP-glucose 4,6-dehydratase
MVIDPAFWNGKRASSPAVGLQGWLALWLQSMGARVSGLARAGDEAEPFELARVERAWSRRLRTSAMDAVRRRVDAFAPEIVLHIAAQSVVRLSYDEPVQT